MAKYRVGDKVRVLDNKQHDNWTSKMSEAIGTTLTIKRFQGQGYYKVEENLFSWYEDWLVPVEFKRKDIKEFDILELRNGRMLLVIYNYVRTDWTASGYSTENWDSDLNHKISQEKDIVTVYRPTGSIPTDKEEWKNLPVVWEREPETKEMTVEEISKALGYNVKIVGSEDE